MSHGGKSHSRLFPIGGLFSQNRVRSISFVVGSGLKPHGREIPLSGSNYGVARKVSLESPVQVGTLEKASMNKKRWRPPGSHDRIILSEAVSIQIFLELGLLILWAFRCTKAGLC